MVPEDAQPDYNAEYKALNDKCILVILPEYLQRRRQVHQLPLGLPDAQTRREKIIYPDPVVPDLLHFAHHIYPRDFPAAERRVYAVGQYFKNIFVSACKVKCHQHYSQGASQHKTQRFPQYGPDAFKFIVQLRPDKANQIDDNKGQRNQAIVDAEFGEGIFFVAQKAEAVAIENVTGDVKGHDEAANCYAHDEQTRKADLVVVFGVYKKIRQAENTPEPPDKAAKQNTPAKEQPLIFLDVQYQQLHRK
jgi:hypothetical protein